MYREKRFQYKVAMSSFTLPIAALLMVLIWLAGGVAYSFQVEENPYWTQLHESVSGYLTDSLLGLVCSFIAGYLLVELNNANALIRVRTRLTTTFYILFLSAMTFLHPFQRGQFIIICLLCSYHILLWSYQRIRPEGFIFFSFIFLGTASIFFSQILYLVPFYYLGMGLFFRSLTFRSLFAGLLGLLLPFWGLFAWAYYQGELEVFQHIYTYLISVSLPDYSVLNEHQIASFFFVLVWGMIGVVHYWRNNFQDKIRVRMVFYFFIMMEFVYVAMLAVFPQYFNTLIFFLLMNSSPLIAHFFALTHTRITNIVFILCCVSLFMLTIYNLWIPSLSSF